MLFSYATSYRNEYQYLRKNTDDQYFYDITLNENKNIEAAPPHGLPIKGPSSGAQTASENTISQQSAESNKNIQKSEADIIYSLRDSEAAKNDTAEERKGRQKSYAMLQAENRILKDSIEKLKAQMKKGGVPEVRELDAKRLASRYLSDYTSEADKAEVTAKIKAIGDYLVQHTGEDMDYDTLQKLASEAAEMIVSEARTFTDREQAQIDSYGEIASQIKGNSFSLAAEDRSELDVGGGYSDFKKRNNKNFRITADGQNIDGFYGEMQTQYGKNIFPDVNNPGEMLLVFEDIFDMANPDKVNPYSDYYIALNCSHYESKAVDEIPSKGMTSEEKILLYSYRELL